MLFSKNLMAYDVDLEEEVGKEKQKNGGMNREKAKLKEKSKQEWRKKVGRTKIMNDIKIE